MFDDAELGARNVDENTELAVAKIRVAQDPQASFDLGDTRRDGPVQRRQRAAAQQSVGLQPVAPLEASNRRR